jgi:hypothetical protein
MMVYNTATAGSGSTAVSPGLYINDGTQWRLLSMSVQLLPPVASNVLLSGSDNLNGVLTSSYTYYSANGATESATTFQWYRGTDSSGSTNVAISGATSATYTLVAADIGEYIRVGVTPGASSGPTPGSQAFSAYIGPIINVICGTSTVSFTYNGAVVTYGTIASPTTGVCYLDRNLGASAVASAYNDYNGYGDLFQWGRPADGHQLVKWVSSTSSASVNGGSFVNGTTTTLSSSDNPGHSLFIVPNASPYDWRSPQNANLWQWVHGVNNPCPTGWYIPTQADWSAESNISSMANGYNQIKLTAASNRGYNGGFSNYTYLGHAGYYWSSTVSGNYTYELTLGDGTLGSSFPGEAIQTASRAFGMSVRCRK